MKKNEIAQQLVELLGNYGTGDQIRLVNQWIKSDKDIDQEIASESEIRFDHDNKDLFQAINFHQDDFFKTGKAVFNNIERSNDDPQGCNSKIIETILNDKKMTLTTTMFFTRVCQVFPISLIKDTLGFGEERGE